ncbi:DUF6503 family protein [Joostella sp. CR20]|uniref:DUF6503 family protein n=1 Tax=Joostella sp. CR20 TaxID=2804312 RepID=UPI00313F0C04
MKLFSVSLLTFISVLIFSCSTEKTAKSIIDDTIEASGMNTLNNKYISFIFRGKKYDSFRNNGFFELKRTSIDSVETTDVLTNSNFTRLVDGVAQKLADTTVNKYKNSVNSVHYFAYLPYGLDGDAVNKELLGEVEINNQNYYKIKVWFNQDGGGEDFEDVFIYWVNTETDKIDFLAYEYHVNEGGMRFREAYNRRTIEGIDFVDYKNYKPKSNDAKLVTLDSLFTNNQLELLSTIELQNVTVNDANL